MAFLSSSAVKELVILCGLPETCFDKYEDEIKQAMTEGRVVK